MSMFKGKGMTLLWMADDVSVDLQFARDRTKLAKLAMFSTLASFVWAEYSEAMHIMRLIYILARSDQIIYFLRKNWQQQML